MLVSRAGDPAAVSARAERTVELALADFSVDAADAAVSVDCRAGGGCRPGDEVTATVRVIVPLPFVPDGLPLSLPVEGTATLAVARFPSPSP
ncbi:hypothetical protein [Naasia aerilata]|uniref:Uncharacterized protein n=1 Tax=Naasia aerilata TaxID=1162966 RepID=A0ABM8G8A1_9MICO|nr:hypothetical protein [Naasia aerilata]BDZ44330.1 hypothetical protein GCM10025866_02390 [Naasia aerilata]